MKIFDSEEGVGARCEFKFLPIVGVDRNAGKFGGGERVDSWLTVLVCLHSSFELEGVDGKKWEGVRESIEVRVMVFDCPPKDSI
jgi:hypothetical protein